MRATERIRQLLSFHNRYDFDYQKKFKKNSPVKYEWFTVLTPEERKNAIEKYCECYWYKELYELKSHDYLPYKISLKHLLNHYS